MTAFLTLNYNDSIKTVELANKCAASGLFDYIVVVDNNSKEDEVNFLKNNLNETVTLIQAKKNNGFASGNNIGFKYLSNIPGIDYVLIANPDVIFNFSTVTKLLEILNNNSKIAAVSCLCKELNGTISESFRNFRTIKELFHRFLLLRNKFFPLSRKFAIPSQDIFYTDCLRGSFIFFNFDALRKVGFFDENTFLYYEEDILFTKLHKLGYLSCVLNNEFYIHNHPIIKKKKTNIFILKETYKSLYYYLCKYRNINLIHKIRFHLLSKITIFEFLILNLFRRN